MAAQKYIRKWIGTGPDYSDAVCRADESNWRYEPFEENIVVLNDESLRIRCLELMQSELLQPLIDDED